MPINEEQAVNQDLIDRYVRNELNDSELTEFELMLLEDDKLYQIVCEAEAMANAFKAEGIRPGNNRSIEYLSLGYWIRQPASIAACLLLVTSLSFQFNSYIATGNSSRSSGLGVPTELLFETQRSQRDSIVSSGAAPILLKFDAGPVPSTGYYSLAFFSGNEALPRYTIDNLTADSEGWVRVVWYEDLEGDYRLEMSWNDAENELQRNTYEVSFR